MTLARSLSLRIFVVSALSLLTAACGGKSIGNDDLTSTPDPTEPPPVVTNDAGPAAPRCSFNAAVCDAGDVPVASEASCGDADYCYSRRSDCSDSLLWCAHRKVVQCGAIPRCDKGDDQVVACPDGGPNGGLTCYPRTLCGSTILCVHHDACAALPSCNPGDVEVTDINTCAMKGISCYPVTECNYTIHCYTP